MSMFFQGAKTQKVANISPVNRSGESIKTFIRGHFLAGSAFMASKTAPKNASFKAF